MSLDPQTPPDASRDLVAILQQDYARFPHHQTYSIYDPEVYFKDPLNEFRGLRRYQQMIAWLGRWLHEIHLDLHAIHQTDRQIQTQWTLSARLLLPWGPRLHISGWTELHLNEAGLIAAHIDHWLCSPWQVVAQAFGFGWKD